MRRVAVGLVCAILSNAAASAAAATLSWSELGYRAARPEAQAQGPSAVAVDAQGRTWVLDRLNGRAVRVGERVEQAIAMPEDSELLAVGSDGSVAAYSALRSRVELFAGSGASIGALPVPRTLGPVGSIALGPSHRVSVGVALQERYELGSPRFPLSTPSTMAGKREGAFTLADGRGVAVVASKGAATLLVSAATNGKPSVQRVALGGVTDAAQLVGVDGGVACVRLERLGGGKTIEVTRRLRCVEASTGAVVLDEALPAPGVYAPRSELAVGGGTVALIHPTASGLTITRWSLRGGAR